jgi:hypothetical protein
MRRAALAAAAAAAVVPLVALAAGADVALAYDSLTAPNSDVGGPER